LGLVVVAGVVAVVAGVVAVLPPAGVAAPVSVGSAGEVVALVEGVSPPPSQAPSAVAKPRTRAIPMILVFITTPLSPIAANINFSLLNTIPHLLIFLNFLDYRFKFNFICSCHTFGNNQLFFNIFIKGGREQDYLLISTL
jgi:hypothetical protein